jgi:Holliday junction DNA helicase RuvA
VYDHIQGEVVRVQPARVVLRANGVGYELQVPMGVSSALRQGVAKCLYTILHVTDGNSTLLGFADKRERDFARMLMGVSGVGPAMSLAILSTYTVEQIARALVDGEHALLKSVKGVGTKTAERLCLELRDKVGKLQIGDVPSTLTAVLMPQSCEDAVGALMTLGYSEKEAQKKVSAHHRKNPKTTTEQLIKLVLRG